MEALRDAIEELPFLRHLLQMPNGRKAVLTVGMVVSVYWSLAAFVSTFLQKSPSSDFVSPRNGHLPHSNHHLSQHGFKYVCTAIAVQLITPSGQLVKKVHQRGDTPPISLPIALRLTIHPAPNNPHQQPSHRRKRHNLPLRRPLPPPA